MKKKKVKEAYSGLWVDAFIFLALMVIILLWGYGLSSFFAERLSSTHALIEEVVERMESEIINLSSDIEGRWSLKMQEEYTKQLKDYIDGNGEIPNAEEIRDEINSALP